MAVKIDVGVCERLITAATSHCSQASAQVPAPVVVHEPNWEGVTTSLTALSADMAFGLLVLAVATLALGAGWGYLVTVWAEREARKVAEEKAKIVAEALAEAHVKVWLNTNAPSLVSQHMALLYPLTPDDGPPSAPGAAADEIGERS